MLSNQIIRGLSTSCARQGKKHFKKFNIYEMRMTKAMQKEMKKGKYPEFEKRFSRGVREPYLPVGGQEFVPNEKSGADYAEFQPFPSHWEVPPNMSEEKVLVTKPRWAHRDIDPYDKEFIPEMIPDIIVPDLDGFTLKPYVSYRVPDIEEPEFTPQDLFHAVYTEKIMQDFKNGTLNEDMSPQDPSPAEQLTREQAKIKAQQTGSDYI